MNSRKSSVKVSHAPTDCRRYGMNVAAVISKQYVPIEDNAREAKRGLWKGKLRSLGIGGRETGMNKIMHHALILSLFPLVALTVPEVRSAERVDELLWDCEGRGEIGELGLLRCASYLAGFNDYNAVAKRVLGQSLFCPPEKGISNDQLRLVFIKWAKNHPEDLHRSARMHTAYSLAEAFPCPK